MQDALLHAANVSTLLACMLLKLPQIFLLLRARSASGLSLDSLLLELSGFTVFLSYQVYHSYPPPTYLEYPILIAQDAIILLLMLHYSNRLGHAPLYALLLLGCGWLVTLHRWMVDLAMSLCTLISAASKLAQLQCLWRSKDAGQVSALTWLLAVYTCAARIYTTAATTGDLQVLLRFTVTTALNVWVLLTVLHYQNPSRSDRARKQE